MGSQLAKYILFLAFALSSGEVFSADQKTGVYISGVEMAVERRMKPKEYEINILKDRMRYEGGGGAISGKVLIYRKDLALFWLLDANSKTYLKVTEAELEELRLQLKVILDKFKDKVEKANGLEKRMMKSMLDQIVSGKAISKNVHLTYKNVGSDSQFGTWKCQKKEGYLLIVKIAEACVAGWKTLGVQRGDLTVLTDMVGFAEEFLTDVGVMDPEDFYKFGVGELVKGKKSQGFPVQIKVFTKGDLTRKTEMRFFEKRKIDLDVFEVPKDYKSKSIPWDDFKIRIN